jgi:ABC-type multidrug transport system fused ATPase/permease subunit
MDEETEKIIEENINNLFEKSTILFVGNDLQMIDKCDRIIILDNGEIIEDDSLENIKENKKSKFYSLYNDMIQ